MQLLKQYQPHAAGFNGDGLMPSPVKWCGTESGYPSTPIWSTGCGAPAGDPTASDYCPTGVDTYLQVRERVAAAPWGAASKCSGGKLPPELSLPSPCLFRCTTGSGTRATLCGR